MLQIFHHVEEFERFLVVLRQLFFEMALVTQMAAVEHVRVDVTPDFGKMRDIADLAVARRRRPEAAALSELCGCAFR